jgi:hypothetical protein
MIKEYEKVILSKKEFDNMYEYSTSLPSGTYYGKCWKAKWGAGWFMGEYVPDPRAKIGKDGQPDSVKINWRKIEVEGEDISNIASETQ